MHEAAQALSDDPGAYLAPTWYLDHQHPRVREFIDRHAATEADALARARALYYAVRDGIRYDPYAIRARPGIYRASHVLEQGRGYCVQKAVVFAAVCRGAGIPARPGFADVKNHLATERLLRLVRSNLFVYHGYVEVYLEGRWVKATPVFNLSLCEKFQVQPLEFDGLSDSLLQPFDARGRQHMEYVRDRGVRADLPYEELTAAMLEAYPHYFEHLDDDADFEAEAASQGAMVEHPGPAGGRPAPGT